MKLVAIVVLCVLVFGLVGMAIWLYTPDVSKADLETKYHVAASDYHDIAGSRIYVRDSGPRGAPVVVMLHGFGSSLETWDGWAGALAGSFRVVRFDWPGFGLTGSDPSGDYTDARSLAVLKALLDHLGIARASLIGNSMGGKFAWMFAARNPARVDKLVLISPDGFASAGLEYGKAPQVPFAIRLLPYVLPSSLVRMSLAPAFGDPARLTDALVERYRDFMIAPGVRPAMIARLEQVVLEPPEPLLGTIQAPTLLVWGEKDGMIPFPNEADYVRLIPKARLVAFPDLGHVPQEEAPARSLEPVRAFLEP